MKIEAGKRYVTRGGEVVGPFEPYESGHPTYKWRCNTAGLPLRRDDGRAYDTEEDPADLVAEYVEPGSYGHPADGEHLPPMPYPTPSADLQPDAYDDAALDALAEVRRAKALWPGNANSAHEQFAVTDEEIDELLDAAGVERLHLLMAARGRLWAHVKVNQKRRDLAAMRKEAIQVAAMALRFAAECCDEMTGRK